MISDNYVTGDNIYLRELQNFFFEVLGMMSITHYGAIGDGRRDNYGPIQVAIDDANRRGLSFLYVPYGKFIYTGEFTNLIDPSTGKQRIIFIGNPHAHIVNIRTGEEMEIKQFGWCDGPTPQPSIEVHDILENMILVDGEPPTLEEGFYYTGTYGVYINSATSDNILFGPNEIFYYHASDKTLIGALRGATYDTNDDIWVINENIMITNEITDDRSKIPTSKAVKDYVDSIVPQEGEYRFMSFIAPTHWDTMVSTYKEYTTTDGYGLWRAYADSSAGSDWIVSNLFDGNDSTSWKCDDISLGETVSVGIDFPVLIKPTELRVMPAIAVASQPEWPVVVQFQNADDTWDTLWSFNLPNSQTPTELVEEVSPNKWYKAFRAVLTRPSGGTSQKALASLEVTKGYWKEA